MSWLQEGTCCLERTSPEAHIVHDDDDDAKGRPCESPPLPPPRPKKKEVAQDGA